MLFFRVLLGSYATDYHLVGVTTLPSYFVQQVLNTASVSQYLLEQSCNRLTSPFGTTYDGWMKGKGNIISSNFKASIRYLDMQYIFELKVHFYAFLNIAKMIKVLQ